MGRESLEHQPRELPWLSVHSAHVFNIVVLAQLIKADGARLKARNTLTLIWPLCGPFSDNDHLGILRATIVPYVI